MLAAVLTSASENIRLSYGIALGPFCNRVEQENMIIKCRRNRSGIYFPAFRISLK